MISLPCLRKLLNFSGGILAVMAIVYVALQLKARWDAIHHLPLHWTDWATLSVTALSYGASNFFLCVAWGRILRSNGTDISIRHAFQLYGVTQLARYLPGNIFHLAGRQALGMAAGFSGKILFQSTVWELGLIAVAGSLFIILLLPLATCTVHAAAALVFFIAAVLTITAILVIRNRPQIAAAFIYQVCFLTVSAGTFASLLLIVSADHNIDNGGLLSVGGAFVVAWLIGLVTPGAPAGVGVREFVLLQALNGVVSESGLLTAVLIARVVTVVGDVLFFLAAALTSARQTQ